MKRMMGFALFDLDVPTTKTTSALLCMTEDEASGDACAPQPFLWVPSSGIMHDRRLLSVLL